MTIQNATTTPTAEELVQRARDLVPFLRERADAVEKAREVPAENIEALRKAGFFKITQPAEWGGYEMDLEVFARVAMEIGRGCPSTVWNLGVLGVHNWEMGKMSRKAQEDVWGENPETLVGSSYAPFGKAEKVDGGWVLNGHWRTSSGSDHAQWTFFGAYEYDEDGNMLDHKAFLVPRSEYTFLDDWYTFGLQGTGSKSLILENVFVPDYRVHSIIEQPAADHKSIYKLHQSFVFFTCISAGIIGFAQGGIDLYIEHMKERVNFRQNSTGSKRATTSPYVKDRLGNAVLKVRSSRARLLNAVKEAGEYIKRGEAVPPHEALHFMLDTAAVGKECSEAVILLHRAQSARGVFLTSPLQRVLRDILAGANHGTQNSDDTAGALGGYLLGDGIPPLLFNVNGYPPQSE